METSAGAVGNAVKQYISKGKVNGKEALATGALSAVTAGATKIIGAAIKPIIKTKVVQQFAGKAKEVVQGALGKVKTAIGDTFAKPMEMVANNRGGIQLGTQAGAVKLPKGATFEGKIYRSVKEGYDPLEMNSYTINSNHRYTQPGTEGLYFSTGERIVNAELGSNNITSMAGRRMYSYDTKLTNMLDLSNPKVRDKMRIKLDDLLSDDYRINIGNATTHQMGEFAKAYGYNGIIAPSARADGGLNIILFDATKLR